MSSIKDKILTIVLTAAVSGSLGYGASQAALARTVMSTNARLDVQDAKMQRLQEIDSSTQATIKEMRETNTAHMTEVVKLFEAAYAQNRDFIALVKTQNELLMLKAGIKP